MIFNASAMTCAKKQPVPAFANATSMRKSRTMTEPSITREPSTDVTAAQSDSRTTVTQQRASETL